MLNTYSTFAEQQLRILKMADDEMLLSLCVARDGAVQKRKTEKLELEVAIKKYNLFRDIYGTPTVVAPLVELIHRQKVDVLIYRNFFRMNFYSLKELPQLETPVIINLRSSQQAP